MCCDLRSLIDPCELRRAAELVERPRALARAASAPARLRLSNEAYSNGAAHALAFLGCSVELSGVLVNVTPPDFRGPAVTPSDMRREAAYLHASLRSSDGCARSFANGAADALALFGLLV